MTEFTPISRIGRADVLVAIARVGVGGLFIYMGLAKALDPVAFLKLIRQYEIVSHPVLLNLIAATLPWFEVVCGSLLVLGVAVRGTALASLAMLVPFTALVWHRALGIASAKVIAFCAVKFDCGCGAGEVFICRKLLENFVLMAVAAVLVAGCGRVFSLRYELFASKKVS